MRSPAPRNQRSKCLPDRTLRRPTDTDVGKHHPTWVPSPETRHKYKWFSCHLVSRCDKIMGRRVGRRIIMPGAMVT